MSLDELPNNKDELDVLKLKNEILKLQTDAEKSKKELELLKSPLSDNFKKVTILITIITAIGTISTVGLSYYTTTKLYDVRAKELEIKAIKYDIQLSRMKRLRPKLEELKNINPDENQNPIDRHNVANNAIILLDTILNEIR